MACFGTASHIAAGWLLLTRRDAAPERSPRRKAAFGAVRNAFLGLAVRMVETGARMTPGRPGRKDPKKGRAAMRAAPEGPVSGVRTG